MGDAKKYPGKLVFGLDIGTRSIIGTVGYKNGDKFYVVAQEIKEHETRAMLDGQIHDIAAVGATIQAVKTALEEKSGVTLAEVCIAAAGRVLQTVKASVEIVFETDTAVTQEEIYSLESFGVEKAYEEFTSNNQLEERFYCVGYSVVKYYLNGHPMSNLENHKARKIALDLIVTLLPDEVVDGLYRSVEFAGLEVASMTLEPIAAIQLAIPEMYRMLNIALVDVGAGTSDVSITKDGSIVAYGMLPIAGDSLTEVLAQHCLVDFVTAEHIKRTVKEEDKAKYKDIMGLSQEIAKEEVLAVLDETLERMTGQVAEKIKELNGDKSVSAVFVVGGGGIVDGYTGKLAAKLAIQAERVGLRGEEVMQKIIFLDEDVEKSSLLVTPIGICLNYYEQSNNFIYVTFNGKRIKIYDNNKLAIVDAAMQAEFPNSKLFAKRGPELNFTVNGKSRIVRGKLGEPARIMLNGEPADLYASIHANDKIVVTESTAGEAAEMEINELPEYNAVICVEVNNIKVELPKFATVNEGLQSGFYSIQDGDVIEMIGFYTVKQILDFMDIILEPNTNVYVNTQLADFETPVYDNFKLDWVLQGAGTPAKDFAADVSSADVPNEKGVDISYENLPSANGADISYADLPDGDDDDIPKADRTGTDSINTGEADTEEYSPDRNIFVIVNNAPVTLTGKMSYVFVDVFDFISFDLSKPQGKGLITDLNGRPAQYMEPIREGDTIDIYWKE